MFFKILFTRKFCFNFGLRCNWSSELLTEFQYQNVRVVIPTIKDFTPATEIYRYHK